MLSVLFVLACNAMLGECYSDKNTSILTRLPDIIGELCPGVNVCRENQTSRAPEKVFPTGYESCCAECSCGPNCEESRNCCFPKRLPFPNQDNSLNVLEKGLACIFPTTAPPIKDRMNYRSYYMISSLPNHNQDDKKSVSNMSCGEEIVAPWGSLYPVYSPQRKQIYKNIACATVDGVTDGVVWDAILDCHTKDSCNFISWSDLNSIDDNALVYFVYPGNRNDIRPLKCFVDPAIETCPDSTEFNVLYETGLSSEDVVKLCRSGFISPYRSLKMYANVFCSICNAKHFNREKMCTKTGVSIWGGGSHTRGLSGLIDSKLINDIRINKLEGAPEIPKACDILNDSRCRPMLCPTAKLRDKTGECKYLNKIWYDQVWYVFINLTIEEVVNMYEVFRVEFGRETKRLPALKSPWTKYWSIEAISYELTDGYQNHTTLRVVVSNNVSAVQPSFLLKNIRKMVKRDWILEHNNSRFVFKSTFMSLATVHDKEALSKHNNLSASLAIPQFILLFQRKYHFQSTRAHLITKLYVCNQVELRQSDFILIHDNTVLFNTITQRFMFDGEFALLPSSTGGVRARICIEDSGMYKQEVAISKGLCVNCSFLFVAAAALICGLLNHLNI